MVYLFTLSFSQSFIHLFLPWGRQRERQTPSRGSSHCNPPLDSVSPECRHMCPACRGDPGTQTQDPLTWVQMHYPCTTIWPYLFILFNGYTLNYQNQEVCMCLCEFNSQLYLLSLRTLASSSWTNLLFLAVKFRNQTGPTHSKIKSPKWSIRG